MSNLREFQLQFIKNLYDEQNEQLSFIKNKTSLSPRQQLNIYSSSVFGALQKVLKEIFPVCHKLVGDDFFIVMIDEYIKKNPSYSADLGDYGHSFADFIRQFIPARTLPYLADVAALEWAWHSIFTAPQRKSFDFNKLSRCSTAQADFIQFFLPPKSFLLMSPYPIHRIWEVNQEKSDNDQIITLPDNSKFYFFIWRQHVEMHIDELTFVEWQVLTWIQAGFTLSEINENAEEMLLTLDLTLFLPMAFQKGWLAHFKIKKSRA